MPSTDARALFGGIAARYDTPAEILSFGRYAAWRRALVRAMGLEPGAHVLDAATGTGLIAQALERRYGCHVVGLDLSEAMLRAGARAGSVCADAATLPFRDGSFDALTFSYLLRYVDDPPAVLRELVRVVRPGGRVGSVEFGVPRSAPARAGWRAYAAGVVPRAARAFGPGWRHVGEFLPGSIEAWAASWPPERQADAWHAAGLVDVRARPCTLGAGIVMVGTKRG